MLGHSSDYNKKNARKMQVHSEELKEKEKDQKMESPSGSDDDKGNLDPSRTFMKSTLSNLPSN